MAEISSREIAQMALENGEIAKELQRLKEEFHVAQGEIIAELGRDEDTNLRAWKAHALAVERHSDLYARLCELEEEVARRRAIMDTMVAAGWASSFERETQLWDRLRRDS